HGAAFCQSAAPVVSAAHERSRSASAPAVLTWLVGRGFRPGVAWLAGGWGTVIAPNDCPTQGGLASGVRHLELASTARARSRLPVGGWHLRQGGPGEGEGSTADGDRRVTGWPQSGAGGQSGSARKH